MGLVYLGLLCTASIGVVLGLIQYYRNKRTVGLPVLLIVFLGFLFPLSITFLLPIDVSSVHMYYAKYTHWSFPCRQDLIGVLCWVEVRNTAKNLHFTSVLNTLITFG